MAARKQPRTNHLASADDAQDAVEGETVQAILTEHDVYLLAEGTYRHSWERLGAHPLTVDGVAGTLFAVWAPKASAVSVIGAHNDWDPAAHPMVKHGAAGIWERFIPAVGPGALYKYHVVPASGGSGANKADPYAFHAEAPPGSASVVYDLAGYDWSDGDWVASRAERQRHDRPLSIYEVHAGSWRRVPEEGGRPLTYRELGEQLAPYVRDLGFTHVELMPITEYPADASWGYQVTGYFAPTARYGTPHDFMAFVDECHRHGLGVILDWVPAHFSKAVTGREDHGLGRFDGGTLYEHADPRIGEQPVWGTWVFDFGRAEVRNFLLSSARFWLDQYHVDGFRVDAVANMVWLDHARPESHWGENKYGGRENLDAADFLRRFNHVVHTEFPGVITAAEESTSYNWVTTQPTGEAYDGRTEKHDLPESLGFDYKWSMGWMHDTLDYFELDPVLRPGSHNLLTFPIWYAFNERYILPLSHDEVVHLKKALLTKMPGDDWQRFANLRALHAYMASHPGKKLLFMGGEIGQWEEWQEWKSLDWHLLEWSGPGGTHAPLHRGIQQCVRDLNQLYAALPALHQLDSQPRGFDWIDYSNTRESVISYLRRGYAPGEVVVVVCNFTPVMRQDYPVGVPIPGDWTEVFTSDAAEYGGSGVRNGTVHAVPGTGMLGHGTIRCGQSVRLTLPPLGVVYLRPAPH